MSSFLILSILITPKENFNISCSATYRFLRAALLTNNVAAPPTILYTFHFTLADTLVTPETLLHLYLFTSFSHIVVLDRGH